MGGMTSSQTTSTPTMPGYVKGLYKDIYKDVNKFYNKGKMPVYSEPTTASLTDQQRTALTGMMDTASANSGGAGMSAALQSIMENGGFNRGQAESLYNMRGLADNAGLNELINGNGLTRDQNQAFDAYKGTVYGNNAALQQTFDSGGLSGDQNLVAAKYRGEMLSPFDINANPAYAQVRQRALDAGAQSVAGQAAKMGRLGGAANQNILARAQSDTAANMDLGEYRNWQQRGDAAAAGLAGLGQTGISNQLGINSAQQSGLQGVANMGQMGVDNRNNAIGVKSGLESQLFNMNQAGLDNMGKAYDTAQKPYQTMMGAGNILQQQQQNVINDKMRMFDARNPMNAYQQFLGLASGMPTGQTQTTTPSTLQMLLGGGLGTMGLLGGLGMFGGGGNPAGSSGAI